MKTFYGVGLATLVIVLVSNGQDAAAQDPQAGQSSQGITATSPQAAAVNEKEAAKIKANLAKLSEEDRELAQAQGFCPVMVKNRLGVMGPPLKVMVNDQPVFVCCKGCERKALANPDRTLQIVAHLQIGESLAKLSPEDRRLAEAQGYCPVMRDNPLGVMGKPVKVMVGNEPVFLCCAGCKRRALANPNQTLAIVADLRAKVADEAARKAKAEAGQRQR
jgi:hypothetical protein